MGGQNRYKSSKPIQCCCERHQLTVLVISMTIVFFLTIVYCVYYVHSKLLIQITKYIFLFYTLNNTFTKYAIKSNNINTYIIIKTLH